MRVLTFVILFCLLVLTPTIANVVNSATAIGWTGNGGDLSGLSRRATDIWTGRSSWNDLKAVGWPAANADFKRYVQTNSQGVVNFATGLIPHGLPSSGWNAMLDEVASGAHDDIFVAEGQNMAKYGTQTVYCRPWWEMTIETKNLGPAKFRSAWDHAIPILRSSFAAAAPTKQFKIVFCYLPNAAGNPKLFFPSANNVDVIDADIYGKVWGRTTPSQSAMMSAVQRDLNDLSAFAAAEGKPAAVSEWANFAIQTQGASTNQGRGDDPEYIDTMLTFGFQHHFLYMVYFNILGGGVKQTFANTPLSLAHFKAALK